MGKSIRVVVYDKKWTGKWSEAVVKNYKDYYKLLDCSCFDVVRLSENISIYIDDEGLLVDDVQMSMVMGLGHAWQLAGNLVFTGGVDSKGNTLGLPEDITIQMLRNVVLDF